MASPLPIDPSLDHIVERLRRRGALVLVAEPGAGKTTRVPPVLLRELADDHQGVVVTQPRRLAARLSAHRVAEELGGKVGELVGYQVRGEDRTSAATRLRFVTEGVLVRQLLDDAPELDRAAAIVLDEFHERHLQADLALALAQRRRARSSSPALVLMSATLEAEPASVLIDAPVVTVPGRCHEVTVEYDERGDDSPLERRIAAALRRLRARGVEGDLLVFLPGAAEIRRSTEACAEWAEPLGVELRTLHGNQALRDQVAALSPSTAQRVIFTTNVAETSLTIEGVEAVVDSGLARSARHSPWSGLTVLETRPISLASATQRAGRAGRLGPGRCLRLGHQAEWAQRPDHDPPEMLRADLSEMVLALSARDHIGGLEPLTFLDPPPERALEAASTLLRRLGLVDASGAVTGRGRDAAALGAHPRLGRLMIEAAQRGAGDRGCLLAALLEARDIRSATRTRFSSARPSVDEVGPSDGLGLVERFEALEREGFRRRRAAAQGLDLGRAKAVHSARRAYRRRLRRQETAESARVDADQVLMLATLAAFPDRVGWRRRPRGEDVVFADGGSGRLSPNSVVKEAELLVAVDAESNRRGQVIIRSASRVEPEWLIELFADELVEEKDLRVNESSGAVERREVLRYGALVLDEQVSREVEAAEAAELLASRALAEGIERFFDAAAIEALRARVAFAAEHFDDIREITDADLRGAVLDACQGRSSLADLSHASLSDLLLARLGPRARQRLDRVAPEHVSIPGRRRVVVRYVPGRPPSIASRLQDFFGARRGPTVAEGRQPLVLHLLAPNQRAVQVTTDLEGFWSKHYPDIRKQLRRRYPKHAWPENPLEAKPSRPGQRR